MRVGGAFQHPHRFGHFRAVCFLDPFTRHNSISMFAAHRAAQSHHQGEDFFPNTAQCAHAFAALQIQDRANMQTAG